MQKDIRILAAVMFTDIVGYTAMMQYDEQDAYKKRERHRKVLESLITKYQGKIVQYYGDGTLNIFGSAIESVNCAVEIQNELLKEPKVPLRIGIHIGDIVYNNEGAYGDGVNIASRVESLSVPGGVLISEKVYDEIRNQPEFSAISLGKFELKNVTRAVELFALTNEGLAYPSINKIKANMKSPNKSVAVLPFVNMSADPENEYFSDGITEELLNALTKVDGLQVTSRTSSFAFKGKNEDVRQIGKQLCVTSILEGSVRKAGNKVRITSQLINTADGYHIWSEVYDRKLEDIFEVQDEIARKIANTLREKLTGSEAKEQIVKSPTKNLDAYNKYLKGRFYYNKWNPSDAKKAIKLFEEAISIEQYFALPYAGLSQCYTLLGSMGQLPSNIAFPKAKAAAMKALELNNQLAEPYVLFAWISFFYELDWKSAEGLYKKTIHLNPDSADAHQGYAVFLLIKEKYDEAIAEQELAFKLDPLSLPIDFSFAFVNYCSGRFEDALKQYDKTLELDPTFKGAKEGKGYIYARTGKVDKAIKIFKQIYEQLEDPLKGITGLGYAYAKAGNIEEAEKCLKKLKQREQKEKDVSLFMDFAIIYTGLRNTDKVLYYFEKAIDARVGTMLIFADPVWKELRSDPRFEKLKEKIRL